MKIDSIHISFSYNACFVTIWRHKSPHPLIDDTIPERRIYTNPDELSNFINQVSKNHLTQCAINMKGCLENENPTTNNKIL